ncbi:conserved protein of unknown function （Phosphohydrolases&|uniref:Calcineurin-like phosphoesterase domain-containing protein n=1 Tax=Magnetospirillum gryphiswaldense (strain DSM 6361 / JCM 21280 / NBRC 15271 / MSR-1) TaxID=431944 RepID=V6F2B9_MAGGM|nr:metallophosphoesterase [Magnetospirillum gryphiswaldense]CDK98426.1 conserved protein of unknown function \
MRLIAHLSDLHFGRTDPMVVDALVHDIAHHRPHLAIISGDLTQRAKSHQFLEARKFLERLGIPVLVVPGNHDLAPVYRPLNRLLNPRAKFEKYLPASAHANGWNDDEIIVIGLDSTRHLRWQSGKLRDHHLDHVEDSLQDSGDHHCKIVFLHHPPSTAQSGHPFHTLTELGVDLILAGHVHKAHVDLIDSPDHGACVLVQASTACSTRLREDANGYALIRIDGPSLEVDIRGWSGTAFHAIHHYGFVRAETGWRRA